MTAEVVDLGPIVPDEAPLTVEGVAARVGRLRSREVFALAKIISAGLGGGIPNLDFDDEEELKGQVVGLMIVALPNAVEETVAFLMSVVHPVNSKDERKLRSILNNPAPGDLIKIVEVLVDQEAGDLIDLVGNVQAVATKIRGLYRDRKTTTG
jgi:hypothetical protein